MDGVRTIISAITNSASGNNELPTSILTQCMDPYLDPLTHLINFKGEDEQIVQNYRPISVPPFFLKIFEKMLLLVLLIF